MDDQDETEGLPEARTNAERASRPASANRRTRHLLQAGLLFIILAQGLPTIHPAQDALRDALDPWVDAVGLWQGQWELFGPEPDRINVRVVAVVRFEDGFVAEWRSPDWQAMSAAGKFRHFRLSEFVDGIRRGANRGAWPAMAAWVARQVAHPADSDARPVQVALWRHWVVIPPPTAPPRPIAAPLPMSRRYKFYERRLPQ